MSRVFGKTTIPTDTGVEVYLYMHYGHPFRFRRVWHLLRPRLDPHIGMGNGAGTDSRFSFFTHCVFLGTGNAGKG